MLEEKKEAQKEPKTTQVSQKETKSEVKTKDYTVIKVITLKEVHTIGSTISVEVGSDLEKELLIGKFINKHGVSRPN